MYTLFFGLHMTYLLTANFLNAGATFVALRFRKLEESLSTKRIDHEKRIETREDLDSGKPPMCKFYYSS